MSSRIGLLGVIILAAALRVWQASTPDYLHEWDERYHALVARNLLLHPLKPTLYDIPILDYDFREWASNHIWLSKPPLPLWIIALSLKFWGFTAWAVRFPSLLFSLGSVLLTYKITTRLWGSKLALWAAFFHAIHGFTLEVGAGRFSSDHVDIQFLFWTELGFWALLGYYLQPAKKALNPYALLVGICTACAFMCKWTAAFMLPLVWWCIEAMHHKTLRLTFLKHFGASSIVFLALALPWPLYAFYQYPNEANFLLKGVLSPVVDTIQGHAGEWYFYLVASGTLFGQVIYLPMGWLLWSMRSFWKGPANHTFSRTFLFSWVFIPLLLLSLAATKRPNYLLCAAPGFFMLTALFMRLLSQQSRKKAFIRPLSYLLWLALLILPVRYMVERTKLFSPQKPAPEWVMPLKALAKENGPSKTVLFREYHPIEAMFYTGYIAYPEVPSEAKLQEIKQAGWRILECQNGQYVER